MKTDKEILEVINKNLPLHVGNVLRERLEEADKLEQTVKKLSDDIVRLNKEIESYLYKIKDQYEVDMAKKSLDEREKKIFDREKNLMIEVATLKQAEAEKRSVDLVELVKIVFRSPVYSKHVVEDKHVVMPPSSPGYTAYTTPIIEKRQEIIKEE